MVEVEEEDEEVEGEEATIEMMKIQATEVVAEEEAEEVEEEVDVILMTEMGIEAISEVAEEVVEEEISEEDVAVDNKVVQLELQNHLYRNVNFQSKLKRTSRNSHKT